jgi:histidinol phosphatase-like PHP family hydrolase
LQASGLADAQGRAQVWKKRLEAVLNMPLPFHKIGIAHLTCRLIAPTRELYLQTLDLLEEEELHRLFAKAAALGVGIELNGVDMKFSDEETETVLRPYRIAKACGCKFYFGTDAHHPAGLDSARPYFERAIDLLGLKVEDQFVL